MTASLETLVVRQEIVDLLTRYATALDTRDWPLLASCFTEDATAEYRGFGERREGYAAIEAGLRNALDGLDSSQHIVTNHVVRIDGHTAHTTCYLQAQHFRRGTEGGDTFTVGATYRDRLVHDEHGWRIAERLLEPTWIEGNRAVFAAARAGKPYPAVAMAARS